MIAVTGIRTTIIRELSSMVSEEVVKLAANLGQFGSDYALPEDVDKFVFAAGVLRQQKLIEQTGFDVRISLAVNLVSVARLCEMILTSRPNARICVIGSESGFNGSFDETYAMCKAAVHSYVSWRKVLETQSLTCVSPPIISDSGMTMRRGDYPQVLKERRTVTARQVAEKVCKSLYTDIYLGSNQVERL